MSVCSESTNGYYGISAFTFFTHGRVENYPIYFFSFHIGCAVKNVPLHFRFISYLTPLVAENHFHFNIIVFITPQRVS